MKKHGFLLVLAALLLLCACGSRSISADLNSSSKQTVSKQEAEDATDTESENMPEEDRNESADAPDDHPADSGDKLGEPVRTAWLDAIGEAGSVVQAPDAAAILSSALAEDPDLSATELEKLLLSALESGNYEMVVLPASDGTDDAYQDALEVMLAQLWIEALSGPELEPIDLQWGG